MRARGFALILAGAIALLMAGCAGGYVTSGGYYAPDYGPYYAGYGYRGGPYYGYDPGYIGGFSITTGRHYHRYYGHHHFRNDSSYRGRYSGTGNGRSRSGGQRAHRHR